MLWFHITTRSDWLEIRGPLSQPISNLLAYVFLCLALSTLCASSFDWLCGLFVSKPDLLAALVSDRRRVWTKSRGVVVSNIFIAMTFCHHLPTENVKAGCLRELSTHQKDCK